MWFRNRTSQQSHFKKRMGSLIISSVGGPVEITISDGLNTRPKANFAKALSSKIWASKWLSRAPLIGGVLAVIFGFSAPAHAIFELRASFGALASQLNLADAYDVAGAPSMTPAGGAGVEALIMPPLFPIGFGVRFEAYGVNPKNSSAEFDWNTTRMALVINSRFLDSFVFLGPIVTYGLSHSSSIMATVNGTKVADWSGTKLQSYTVGVESGVNLLGFVLGGELGFEDFRWKEAQDQISGNVHDFNMSGAYLRLLIGFGI